MYRFVIYSSPFIALFTSLSVYAADTLYNDGAPTVPTSAHERGQSPEFPHFTDLVKELSPAVVNISVESNLPDDVPGSDSPVPGFPFFKRGPGAEEPAMSLGSGFIITSDGYVVTNNHVIDKATKVVVRLLDDKTEYVAKVIGTDPKTDVALIKIDAHAKLKTVFLGDSDKTEIGEWVIAIGNQFQLGQTVTAGIVSAKSRRVNSRTSGPYDQFIQTDASINPGSSGGPLFNTRGQVIGINTAIFSPGRGQFGGTGFNIGIGFSIPVNLAKGIITQLKNRGKVTRGLLGVIIQEVNLDVAQALGLEGENGALVGDVVDGSPAAAAGFKRRDIIVSYNGTALHQHDELPLLVANTPIGSDVTIEVLREGKKEVLKAHISEMKDDSAKKKQEKPKTNELGLAVENVTSEEVRGLEIPKGARGVIVTFVTPSSVADKAGLSRGDVIEEIANQPIASTEEFEKAAKSLKKGSAALILIRRPEGTRYATIKP